MGTPTKTSDRTASLDTTLETGRAIELLLERRLLTPEQAAMLRKDAAPRRIVVARELRERGLSDGGFVSPLEVIASFRFPSKNPRREFIDEEELCRMFAEATNVDFTRIDPLKLDARRLAAIVSKPFALKHLMVPVQLDGQLLHVAMVNPYDRTAIHNIEHATGYSVKPVLGLRGEILKTINEIFAFERSLQKADKMRTASLDVGNLEQLVDVRGDEELDSSDQHVVRAVDLLLQYAFEQRASDIHIEPKRERAVVRLRIDGCLHDTHSIPKRVYPSFVSRIKIMSRLDIAEKRRPQDGRIKSASKDGEIELRVSTVPVAFGEKVVIRIFDPTILLQEVPQLGFTPEQMTSYQHILDKPHGIILVTGPTGSGKTTTLYSSLQHLSSPEVNVITIEDPIEMVHEPFNQIAVQESVGISFANALRSVLRQDPDIIMVGEIRDSETAQYAVQAALTGHLVFSTLHTNTAIGAITRLVDLGIERFLIASTVIGLVAQRLMRLVCPSCGELDHVPAETLQLLGLAGDVNQTQVRRGAGCEKCRKTGFFGRTAAFEVIELTDAMRIMIRDNASEQDIAKLARKDGAEPLLSNAGRKLLGGHTTPEEILRVVPATW
ncbi:MAG TPA: GspE/PulE family protein [Candidatus Krumholzibacteria bacterium]|nr:GspE/PulE family protein [Candidatus Krumholzibacteria bacterium]